MGVSAVALIVAGIYYKYPKATPAEVLNKVEAAGGKTAVDTLIKKPDEVIAQAAKVDPTTAETTTKTSDEKAADVKHINATMKALYNTEDAKIAAKLADRVEKLDREVLEDEIEAKKRSMIPNALVEQANEHARKTKAALEEALEKHKKDYPNQSDVKERENDKYEAKLKAHFVEEAKKLKEHEATPEEKREFPNKFSVILSGSESEFKRRDWYFAGYPTYRSGFYYKSYLYRNEQGHWVITTSKPEPNHVVEVGDRKSIDIGKSPINLTFKILIQDNGKERWSDDPLTQVF